MDNEAKPGCWRISEAGLENRRENAFSHHLLNLL